MVTTHQAPQEKRLAGKTVLAVFAHPDDESLTCAGTLAICAQRGARVVLASMTRGEHTGEEPSSSEQGEKQERELHAAAAALGVEEVIVCDHPDGCLPWIDAETIYRDIERLVAARQPDAIITFGQDGLCWHHDHIVVHEFVLAVASRATNSPPVYCTTIPAPLARRIVDKLGMGGKACVAGRPFGVDAETFGVLVAPSSIVVDVRSVISRKLNSLRCHRTQVEPGSPLTLITGDEALDLFGSEYFHRPLRLHSESLLLEEALPVRIAARDE